MMPAKKKINDILGIIGEQDVSFKLFFITRHIKEGVRKTEKLSINFNLKQMA
ncbi:hypothetical protein L2744_01885 [Shewanella profunda]|uniref:hypothetical protein n=1 Tax=Shewanella profunda TaxID=254793 RepID=UPI00200F74E5|nr:hypothetical protein [Shewanella profunda]MCL1088377.1 hypothetical protein [Shewanella profunda]